MGLFSSIFGSSKSKKLRDASKKLNGMSGSSPDDIAENFFDNMQKSNQGKEELFEIIMSHDKLSSILEKHNMGRDELEDIFGALQRGGAGQMVNGYYVAGCALGFEESLDYLLSNYDKLCGEEVSRESVLSISNKMVSFFQ